jgi:CDGSH-type Zn-finger protein
MSEPAVAKKGAYVLELDPGKYYWCACGRAKTQPFCDGSHAGTGIEPLEFKVEEQERVSLCGCKYSSNPPFCDGAHKQFVGE